MSIYMGIDWSQDKHDVAFMNEAGAIIARLTIPHQPAGFHRISATIDTPLFRWYDVAMFSGGGVSFGCQAKVSYSAHKWQQIGIIRQVVWRA